MSRRTRGQWFSTRPFSGLNRELGRSKQPQTRRLSVEPLEDRRMLAAVVVGNTLNSVNGDTSSINALIASPGADGISLSEAILATNATAGNDAITFAPGIVGGQINTGGFALPTITGNVTIQGPMIVDCWGGFQRAFTIAAGANVTITGFEIRNGYSEFGGAIHNSGTLSLINCNLNTNLGYYGGAIYNAPGAQLSATGTVLRYNEAEGHGGAIYNDGILNLSHSRRGYSTYNSFRQGVDEKGILENKSANHGGAIYNAGGGVLTVTDVSIIWNHAEGLGGGIFNEGTATVNGLSGKTTIGQYVETYHYSAISYNTGFNQGAGAFFNSGNFTLNGASVLANSGGIGGASGVINGGTLNIINSTLGKNYAIRNSGTATITNSNINGTVGVGIRNEAVGTLTLNNTIVAGSTSGDISNSGTLTGSHNFVGDGSGAGLVGTLSGDPKLQPLEPIFYPFPSFPINHGPVPIMLPLAGSPLINGGDSSLVPSGTPVDQRGVKRIKEGIVDIGPVEFGADTLTVTTLVDENDQTVDPSFGTGTSLREALAHVADLEPTDQVTIVFAPGVTGTISLVQAPLPKLTGIAGLTIVGPGDELLTIDADAVAGNYGGILEIQGGIVTISGLTFANGSAFMGGAIYIGGILTLVDCSFIGNSSARGAGAVYSGNLLVATGCNFAFNSANVNLQWSDEGGGAILNFGTMSIADCTFTENTAYLGGAIHTATKDYFESRPNTSFVTSSTFSGNSAVTNGGAITNNAGQYLGRLRVTGSTFYQNTAGNQGGGIYNIGILTVDSSTLYGNSAANVSGSSGGGGGICAGFYDSFYPNYTTINNSIVAGSTTGGDVYRVPGAPGTLFTGGYNFIGDGSGGLTNTITGNPLLGPLQDNGGPTKTMAPLVGSPLIDRGSYDAYPQPLVAPTGVTLTLLPNSGSMPPNTTYTYRVAAVSRWGESLGSTELAITTGSASVNAVSINWNVVPGATSYKVFGGLQGGVQELVAVTTTLGVTHGGGASTYYGTLPPTNTTAIPQVDQRGLARVIGNAIDIGAFERQTAQLAGDYNRNGTVDSADYVLLRKAIGTTGVALFSGADGDGNGKVEAADYDVWRSHFGHALTPGAGSGAATLALVKQPAEVSEVVAPVVTASSFTATVESEIAPKAVEAPQAVNWAAFGDVPAQNGTAMSPSRKVSGLSAAASIDDRLLLVLANERVGHSSQSGSPVAAESNGDGGYDGHLSEESSIDDLLALTAGDSL